MLLPPTNGRACFCCWSSILPEQQQFQSHLRQHSKTSTIAVVCLNLKPGSGYTLSSSPKHPHELCSSTRHPTQQIPGTLHLRVKWQGHEDNHSPPSSAQLRNEWQYTSTPSVCLHGMCMDITFQCQVRNI